MITDYAGIYRKYHELFHLIDELIRSGNEGAELVRIEQLLKELQNSVIRHFTDKEKLIRQHEKGAAGHQSQYCISYLDRLCILVHSHPNAGIEPLLSFFKKLLAQCFVTLDKQVAHEETTSSSKAPPKGAPDAYDLSELYKELGERTFEVVEQRIHLNREIAARKEAESTLRKVELRRRAMVNFVRSWEYWQGKNGEMMFTTPSCERITGYTAAEFIENPNLIYEIIHPGDRELMKQHQMDPRKHEEGEEEVEFRIIRRDGTISWIFHECSLIYGEGGEFLGRRGSNRDHNELHQKRESSRLAEKVFNVVNEAVLVTDQNGHIRAVNPSFTKITGYTFDDVIGQDASILFNDKNEQRKLHYLWRDVYLNGYAEGDFKGKRKDNGTYEGRVSIYCVHNKEGKLTNYVSIFSDVAQQRKNEEHIYKLAHFDLLTELPNRALFTERLQQELIKARRNKKVLALMFIDLDKFKLVNDTYGHHVGDLLLQKVAKRLQNGIRESDTAARIGGDEFVILLPAIHSEKDAIRIGENILASVRRPYVLKGFDINVGVSIGIAIYPTHGTNHEELLTKADTAMYQAKHGGGPSVISYSSVMHSMKDKTD